MKVTKAGKGKTFHIFKDIIGEVLFSSEKTMFLLVNLKAGQVVPEHRHPHEQMGVCLKGKAEIVAGGKKFLVDSGSFYWMKPNESHKVNVLETSTFLDVFSPPREDYLNNFNAKRVREFQLKARAHIYIIGRVQGVFFRSEIRREARKHNVTGWVRNLLDGRVEAVFEGKKEDVERLVEFCSRGPSGARVAETEVILQNYTGEFRDFQGTW